jgi:hypothetical protein
MCVSSTHAKAAAGLVLLKDRAPSHAIVPGPALTLEEGVVVAVDEALLASAHPAGIRY